MYVLECRSTNKWTRKDTVPCHCYTYIRGTLRTYHRYIDTRNHNHNIIPTRLQPHHRLWPTLTRWVNTHSQTKPHHSHCSVTITFSTSSKNETKWGKFSCEKEDLISCPFLITNQKYFWQSDVIFSTVSIEHKSHQEVQCEQERKPKEFLSFSVSCLCCFLHGSIHYRFLKNRQ